MKKRFKTAFRHFIVNENGAVSIYVIIVTLLLFLFNAVLIDFVRIMVAENQVEQASKSAIRSAFSSYNKDVQNKGLFIINENAEDPGEIFEKVFENNLQVEEGSYFRFVDTKMESTSFAPDSGRTFSNKEIVKHQILEDMKYTAPIEFGKVILDGILPYSCTMLEAEIYVDISKDVNDLVKDRDAEMEKAINHMKNAYNQLDSVDNKVNGTNASTYPNLNNLGNAIDHFPTYIEDEDSEFEDDLRNLLKDIRDNANTNKTELEAAIVDLNNAKEINEAIQKKIDDTREEVEGKYGDLSDSQCSDSSMSDVQNEISELTDMINDYVLDSSFFTTARSNIEEALDSVDDGGQPGASTRLLPYVKYQIDTLSEILEFDLTAFRPPFNNIISKFNTALNDTDEARKYIDNNYEETDTGVDGGEDNSGLSDALRELEKIKDIFQKGIAFTQDFPVYTELESLVQTYGNASLNNPGNLDLEDPEDSASDAFDIVSNLFKSLGDLSTEIRNKAYINEYILTRFEADDSLGIMEPGSYPENFLFINREVEYILYGHHAPGINYANALLELSATRFAFNFISSFSQPQVQAVVLPLPKFLAAVGWSFTETVNDITKLTKGEEVPLLKIRGVRSFSTDYKFYLRLFLFLHPDPDDERITRIQSVIDQKSSDDLENAPIYATANAEASIDLWFLPGIIDMLGSTNILEGQVRNGRYYIDTETNYSY
ncbi:DUF5702 domain-containing protein [Oceanobacillus profundus]|uniref:DUF5702 domain-containing protein n=1 Tax=Oceanobacillus TaxID=182709 RepID=UPI0026E43728|nr:DUF5702 domain-containing protein [Oceanobacillus profundus]MDO6448216.1 DUF5702 domain-containing protein [Oceanobacillus profundus]